MITGYDDRPEWEQQMEEMFGPDATGIKRLFQEILRTETDNKEPFDHVEIALTQDEIAEWLEECHLYHLEDEGSTVGEIVFYVGQALSRIYLERPEMEPDEVLSAAAAYFLGGSSGFDDDE